ncbi:helix-turn-helix domain-containing protein [Sporosarcina aquimarina]|uniref:helix-turn-helix domain-containing protein n=1 Tax=Sporosarcina aquimarina TaxID=114975 RepID=UPI001C8DFFFE|nr:helix-turn-helix domain-containing protein [Sporosarcina aquimarina]MBY0224115.1 winged helix-turn-helix domain-containing protein [Sporosarcina aquimarina]
MNINKHQKLLLYILKDMGAENEPVPVTLDKLADVAGMSRLTIQKQLKELKEDNLILVGDGKGKAPNSYMLNFD